MLELPVDGVDAEAMREATRALLASGAPIEVVNAVRRRLSRIKGGRLAEAAFPARVVNVVLSDVPGRGPAVAASGPTLPDPEDVDVRAELARYGLDRALPESVRVALARARSPVPAEVFRSVVTEVAADNRTARLAMVDEAARRGLSLVDRSGFASGEARSTGARFHREARDAVAGRDLAGVVWGGETTVTVTGGGRGGRNEEAVLGAVDGYSDGLVLSVGTDGIDGSSEAAGALLDAEVVERARALGLDASEHLVDNDADAFFRAAGGRIVTGPTGTNVADVCLYLR